MSLAAEVRHYLLQSPRQLPSRALYDPLGSALFDAICELPWYPLTRAERRLIASHRRSIFARAGRPVRIIELGPGNGSKLQLLLGGDPHPAHVARIDLVDVSAAALAEAARRLREVGAPAVTTHQARYEDGLATAMDTRDRRGGTLVLFLGSNIGNFDPAGATAFLRRIREALAIDDRLLIGADLVKPERELLLAYDDPLGVTAAFNKNLLLHLNASLGASFDVRRFSHRALWNAQLSRIEMHLVSTLDQTVDVHLAGLAVALRRGEAIWTESSYKYSPDRFAQLLGTAGLRVDHQWIDAEAPFLLALASPR